jgi:signal transduction histidine kinase
VHGARLILLDVLAAVGFFFLPEISFMHAAVQGTSSGVVWGLSAAAAVPLCVRRIWPLAVFLFVMLVAFAALPFGLTPTSLLAASYAVYTEAVTQPRLPRWSTVVIGGISAVIAAGLTLTGPRHDPGDTEVKVMQILLGMVALGATWAVGASVRERRAGVRRAIEQAAERARTEERLRVAREFHDIATHSIGLIAVKVGVANHVLASHPEEARDALQVIEQVSRTALRDMRAVLRVLRREEDAEGAPDTEPEPCLADVPALIDKARAADVDARLESRHAHQPPRPVALAAYRIIQEALTNVIKHAAPTSCLVSIDADPGTVRIEVNDDGPRESRRVREAGGGFGLTGMRERAAAHNGTLTAGPRPDGGFQVIAVLRY